MSKNNLAVHYFTWIAGLRRRENVSLLCHYNIFYKRTKGIYLPFFASPAADALLVHVSWYMSR